VTTEDEVQIQVEDLSEQIGRGVLVEDPSLRLVAYSPVFGTEDEVRRTAILTREAPRTVRDVLFEQGIATARGPIRTSGNADLGLEPRVCVPIRCQRTLFGYLWVIDADESLAAEAIERAARSATEIGAAMYRREELEKPRREHELRLLEDLLAHDPERRAYGAHELVASDLLVPGARVVVVAVRPWRDGAEALDGAGKAALSSALDEFRASLPLRHALSAMRADEGLVILAVDGVLRQRGGVGALAHNLHASLAGTFASETGWRVAVGFSEERARLEEAAFAHEQAHHAARVAHRVPAHAPVAGWDDLGAYRTLAYVREDAPADELLHPGLRRLFDEHGDDALVKTLETYLEHGCDARLAAKALFLHRASLYHRLQRIEQATGVSLRNGDERLALHAGLKLAWLLGAHPAQRSHRSEQANGRADPARRGRSLRADD
jgi:sugar diacid utilization regulator